MILNLSKLKSAFFFFWEKSAHAWYNKLTTSRYLYIFIEDHYNIMYLLFFFFRDRFDLIQGRTNSNVKLVFTEIFLNDPLIKMRN